MELSDGTPIQIFGMYTEYHGTHWGFYFEGQNNLPAAKLTNYALEIGDLTFRFDADGIVTNNRARQWGLQSDVGTENLFTAGTAITVNLVDTRVRHVPLDPAEIGRTFAKAQPKTAWSSTLKVESILESNTHIIRGCQDDNVGSDSCTRGLTDKDFTYDGTTYRVTFVQVQTNLLSFGLDKVFPADLIKSHRLIVNGKPYHLESASVSGWVNTGDQLAWRDHGQEWEVGDRVRLKLVERDFPTLTAQEYDHSVQPATPSQRTPDRAPSSDRYCYTGDGTGRTDFVRYPDGRITEVPKVGSAVRTWFACN